MTAQADRVVHISTAEVMYPDWDMLTRETRPAPAFSGVPERQERRAGTPERKAVGQAAQRERAAAQRRKERYLARRNALQFAIEVKLIALGYGVLTAAKTAVLAVQQDWQRARDEMRKFGYDYLQMQWV